MGTMGGCGAGAEQQAGLCPPVSLLPLAVLCNPVGALCFPIILLIFFFLMFYFFFFLRRIQKLLQVTFQRCVEHCNCWGGGRGSVPPVGVCNRTPLVGCLSVMSLVRTVVLHVIRTNKR